MLADLGWVVDASPRHRLSLLEFLFLQAADQHQRDSHGVHRAAMSGGLMEAIHSTAMSHPEWPPLGSVATWEQWENWQTTLPSRH
jgi:hypothetical protein